MKDFAKSVRTGNAYSRGQKVGTDGKYEYVINDVMQDGTILVSRHPDGRTFTFSSEQEVKDWLRNSKIGNETLGPNWDKKRQLEDELRGWMTMVNKLEGEEKRNAEKQISDIRKELNDVKIKIAHGENKKIDNESIDKQEWSMFNGLRKDAEKEIGNKAIVLKDGNVWVVLYANETKSQEFESEAEAREFAKKVGNEAPEEMEVKYKGYTITYFPYQKKYMVRHPNEVSGLVQKHFTSVDEAKKAIDKKAIGNEETKAERKFGKVMGEFEEGALKTPQGKTVTDPAQAKAIAYSEADKVDNLKRARNAMKK